MDIERIVADLKMERGRLDQAIAALEGVHRTAAVGKTAKKTMTSSPTTTVKRRRVHTAASRKLLSDAMKKRWAERKKKSGSA